MMRQIASSLIILTCHFAFAEQELVSNPEVLKVMYDLWKDSAFGKDPNRTERAAWIIKDSINEFGYIRRPQSRDRNTEFWYGAIPSNMIAQIHTHPTKSDPRPSQNDIRLAKRIGTSIYTNSDKGIWMANGYGVVKKVIGPEWYIGAKASQ